jgi:rubredoxin
MEDFSCPQCGFQRPEYDDTKGCPRCGFLMENDTEELSMLELYGESIEGENQYKSSKNSPQREHKEISVEDALIRFKSK